MDELSHKRAHERDRLGALIRRYHMLLKDDIASNRREYEIAAHNFVKAYTARKDHERIQLRQQSTNH